MTRQIFTVGAIATAGAVGMVCALCQLNRSPPLGSLDGHAMVDLKAMGDFRLDGTGAIPRADRALDGRPVALEGFACDPTLAAGLTTKFELMYTFSGQRHVPPRLQDRVFCALSGGRTVLDPGRYTMVEVFGVLHVGVHRDADDEIDSVYRMDVTRVDPLR